MKIFPDDSFPLQTLTNSGEFPGILAPAKPETFTMQGLGYGVKVSG